MMPKLSIFIDQTLIEQSLTSLLWKSNSNTLLYTTFIFLQSTKAKNQFHAKLYISNSFMSIYRWYQPKITA